MSVRFVTSTQDSPHSRLEPVVRKHFGTAFAKPIAEHTRNAFAAVKDVLQSMPVLSHTGSQEHTQKLHRIILDSCCGTGESTFWLAKQYPHAMVIGVDKSAHRLARALPQNVSQGTLHCASVFHNKTETRHLFTNDVCDKIYKAAYQSVKADTKAAPIMLAAYRNAMIVRADVVDFWRLLADELSITDNWVIEKHFLLYPNPYPKPHHLLRRWHGHPVFPTLLGLSPYLELRTNWRIYAEEFALAVQTAQQVKTQSIFRRTNQHTVEQCAAEPIHWTLETFAPDVPMTAFERKYAHSGQTLYRFTLQQFV